VLGNKSHFPRPVRCEKLRRQGKNKSTINNIKI